MSALLVSVDALQLRASARAASEMLAYRRRHGAGRPGIADEVLGIWLGPQLEAVLPVAHEARPDASGSDADAVSLRDSCSVSGRWALCWLDGPRLRAAGDATSRRLALLEVLHRQVARTPGLDPTARFFPVLTPAEPAEPTLQSLRRRYPQLVSTTWFVHEPTRGIVPPTELEPRGRPHLHLRLAHL